MQRSYLNNRITGKIKIAATAGALDLKIGEYLDQFPVCVAGDELEIDRTLTGVLGSGWVTFAKQDSSAEMGFTKRMKCTDGAYNTHTDGKW